MSSRPFQRSVAVALAVATAVFTGNLHLLAGSATLLSGRVLAGPEQPRAGVVVTLYDTRTEDTFRSAPTDSRGAFHIDTAPPGTYALLVEAGEGAFLASDSIRLDSGAPRAVSLSLNPGADPVPPQGEQPKAPEPKAPEPPKDQSEPAPAKTPKQKKAAPWAKWVIVGGIVVGGVLVIDSLTKEDTASPF